MAKVIIELVGESFYLCRKLKWQTLLGPLGRQHQDLYYWRGLAFQVSDRDLMSPPPLSRALPGIHATRWSLKSRESNIYGRVNSYPNNERLPSRTWSAGPGFPSCLRNSNGPLRSGFAPSWRHP